MIQILILVFTIILFFDLLNKHYKDLYNIEGFQSNTVVEIDDGFTDYDLELAKKMGATHTLKVNEPRLKKMVTEICNKDGADYVIEAAGKTSTIELGMALLEPTAGELIFASHPKKGEKIHIDPFELICGKKIHGSWGGKSFPDKDIPILDRMYEDGTIDLSNLISNEYKLEEINSAFDDLENRKITRGLILMPE